MSGSDDDVTSPLLGSRRDSSSRRRRRERGSRRRAASGSSLFEGESPLIDAHSRTAPMPIPDAGPGTTSGSPPPSYHSPPRPGSSAAHPSGSDADVSSSSDDGADSAPSEDEHKAPTLTPAKPPADSSLLSQRAGPTDNFNKPKPSEIPEFVAPRKVAAAVLAIGVGIPMVVTLVFFALLTPVPHIMLLVIGAGILLVGAGVGIGLQIYTHLQQKKIDAWEQEHSQHQDDFDRAKASKGSNKRVDRRVIAEHRDAPPDPVDSSDDAVSVGKYTDARQRRDKARAAERKRAAAEKAREAGAGTRGGLAVAKN